MTARTPSQDKLQSFRFRVFEVPGNAGVFDNENPVAGFNNITTPNITIEVAEHRTGTQKYTEKYPGVPTIEDCTMTRGLMLGDNTFYNWVINKYLDKQPFRTDLEIRVYNQQSTGSSPDDKYAKKLTLRNAFPNSVKILGDLDATSSDVNIQELGVACESIELDSPSSVE